MKQASLGHPAPLVKVGKSSSKEPSALSQLLGRPASRVHSSTSHTLPSQTLPHPDQPTKVSPTTSGRSKDGVWITVFFPPPNGEDPVSACVGLHPFKGRSPSTCLLPAPSHFLKVFASSVNLPLTCIADVFLPLGALLPTYKSLPPSNLL